MRAMRIRPASLFLASLAIGSFAGCDSGETGTSGGGSTTTTTTSASGGGGAGGTGGATSSGGAGGTTGGSGGSDVIGGDRPVKMYVSSKYDPATPAPLLVLLHGYGASGTLQEIYFGLSSVADERGYIYAVPDGTLDGTNKRFWNATDACCDFAKTGVDDSAYLMSVVDQIEAQYNIDPKRVFFIGHSNGGFMSYRMACDHADRIAAIVSLAGMTFADDSKCAASEPVAIAHVHGDMDETVPYAGGDLLPGYPIPGAVETTDLWAAHDGCEATTTDGAAKDLETSIPGAETSVVIHDQACSPGGHVELWTIAGGKHIPNVGAEFRTSVFDFFDAHPKP